MKTLIKWPGGKSSEFNQISNLIPSFQRYIEPFFGGGAVFFGLEFKKAIINDISFDLMNFYRLTKTNSKEFQNQLYSIESVWTSVLSKLDNIEGKLLELYQRGELANISSFYSSNFYYLKPFELKFLDKPIEKFVVENVYSKIQRISYNQKKNANLLSEVDLFENIKTGFMAGIYMYYRYVHNWFNLNQEHNENLLPTRAAVFYFVREMCYGSMFRYNSKGEFNIPYGGMSYNRKNLRLKYDYLFSKDVRNKFENTQIHNQDFEFFMNKLELSSNDFVFLDPPYDTEFNDYEGLEFSKNDQSRLALMLLKTKAKFLIIIKETDFIRSLYENHPGIYISTFEKLYTYNVRGRNDRAVTHLLISNFKFTIS